jgi:hypothetical protein
MEDREVSIGKCASFNIDGELCIDVRIESLVDERSESLFEERIERFFNFLGIAVKLGRIYVSSETRLL